MKFEIKQLAISTGNAVVAVFTEDDANILGVYHGDRVKIDGKIYAAKKFNFPIESCSEISF